MGGVLIYCMLQMRKLRYVEVKYNFLGYIQEIFFVGYVRFVYSGYGSGYFQ